MSRFIKPTSLRLPDEKNERHATWLEIFFDLIFAVIIVQLSDRLSKDFTLIGLLKCAGLLVPSIWTWISYTVFAARFDNNDAVHWLMTFIIMFAGAIMAIQIPDCTGRWWNRIFYWLYPFTNFFAFSLFKASSRDRTYSR